MKYTVSIEIALPREQVVGLLADPAHHTAWVRGLVSHELVRGEQGQAGAVSRVVMQAGKDTMECLETVTRREPSGPGPIPHDAVVHYDRELGAEGMWSVTRDRLTEAGPAATLWVSENEYRFDSRFMRLAVPLMRGAFRKQSLRHMRDFQAFAERGTDVRDNEG